MDGIDTQVSRAEIFKVFDDVMERAFAPAARLSTLKQKELLSTEEVAELYGYNKGTLDNWRLQGKGPAFVKDGKLVRYRQSVLQEYFQAREIKTRDQL